nr:unnamed protein product [Spirometra erinaceieuropaei]
MRESVSWDTFKRNVPTTYTSSPTVTPAANPAPTAPSSQPITLSLPTAIGHRHHRQPPTYASATATTTTTTTTAAAAAAAAAATTNTPTSSDVGSVQTCPYCNRTLT